MRLPLKQFWALSTGLAIGLVTTAALLSGTPLVSGAAAAAKDPKNSTAESFRYWQSADMLEREAYSAEPMPPGFQVIVAQFEGPIFADPQGRTLYTWPLHALRNGATGDREGKPSACTGEVLRVTAGLMSPYPAGLVLPDLDTRPSCAAVWPALLAPKDAKKVGKWTVIQREDGAAQWAYDGYPVYTSILDREPGDVRGGTKLGSSNDGGVVRVPIGPKPAVPPEFEVVPSTSGRLLVNNQRYSVYTWDGDAPNTSNCHKDCLTDWTPVRAPEIATQRDG